MITLSQGVHSTAVLRPLPQLLLIIILAILKSQAHPTLLIFSFSQFFQLGHVFFVFHLFLFKAGFAAGIKKNGSMTQNPSKGWRSEFWSNGPKPNFKFLDHLLLLGQKNIQKPFFETLQNPELVQR